MTDCELDLDSDLYKSDQGIQSLGKGTLDDDTTPIQYTAEYWDAIKERLDFPATDVTAIHTSANNKQGNCNAHHDVRKPILMYIFMDTSPCYSAILTKRTFMTF